MICIYAYNRGDIVELMECYYTRTESEEILATDVEPMDALKLNI